MRYFKYNRIDYSQDPQIREEYNALLKKEKNEIKKDKMWTRLSLLISTVVLIVYIFVFVAVLIVIPTPNGLLAGVLVEGLKLVHTMVFIPIGIWIAYWVIYPSLEQKFHANYTRTINKYITNSCPALMSYYELEEPYIVTKCYDSSERDFKNQDICLFIVNNELRIATVLVYGFFNMERNIDCYAYMRYELALTQIKNKKPSKYELRSGETYFVLDKNAKKFFDAHFWVNV